MHKIPQVGDHVFIVNFQAEGSAHVLKVRVAYVGIYMVVVNDDTGQEFVNYSNPRRESLELQIPARKIMGDPYDPESGQWYYWDRKTAECEAANILLQFPEQE